MVPLGNIVRTDELLLAVEIRDIILARVQVPWSEVWFSATWLIAGMPSNWLDLLQSEPVQRDIIAVLRARAELERPRPMDGVMTTSWAWMEEQLATLAK